MISRNISITKMAFSTRSRNQGAAMSHHHGIGKAFAPWLEGEMGSLEYSTFKALKEHFDPMAS
jgi:FAD/FMN-containing dehydrogenase